MKIARDMIDLVGNTPLVRINISGDAPLFGAASAGTQGYASGGEE